MSFRARQTYLLIATQTACVAVGLWMQHRHVISSIHHSLEDKAVCEMDARAVAIAGELEGISAGGLARGGGGLDRAREAIAACHPDQVGVILVDDKRRVLVHLPGSDPDGVNALVPGQQVRWDSVPETSRGTHVPESGTIRLPDGAHIAVERGLKGGSGAVLVHRPAAAIESEAAECTRLLPAIGAMALAWTLAVLTVLGFVVLGRIHERADREHARSTSQALRQAQNLVRTRDAVIFGLAKLAESRDDDTGEHLERISAYSTMLATALRRHPRYANEITPAFLRLIGISSALHDIGKVGIEDSILLKDGPLDGDERVRMEAHTAIGARCLQGIERRLGSSNFLQMARQIALAHHERWDGRGYPHRLSGTAIPLAARIVAVADVYDALASSRPYKPAFPHEDCVAIIREGAGKQFDPDLVLVWLSVESRFQDHARRNAGNAPRLDRTRRGEPPADRSRRRRVQSPASETSEALPELSELR